MLISHENSRFGRYSCLPLKGYFSRAKSGDKVVEYQMFSLVVGDEMEIFLFCNSHKYFFTNVGMIKSKYYISLFSDNPWHR